MAKKKKQEQEADDLRAALLKQKRMDVVEERSTKRQVEFGKNKAKAKQYEDKLAHDNKELLRRNAASYVEWSTAMMNFLNVLDSGVLAIHTRLSGTTRRFVADKLWTLKDQLNDWKNPPENMELECDFVVDKEGKVTPELFYQGRSIKELDKLEKSLGPIKFSEYQKLQEDVTKRVDEQFESWAGEHNFQKQQDGTYKNNNGNVVTLAEFQQADQQNQNQRTLATTMQDIFLNRLVIKSPIIK